MENNLDDVLINSLEEKPQKKSSKRIILIAVASVVLLGVLGVSSLMLAKGDTKPKNPEFSELEIELEKLSPTPIKENTQPSQQEEDFDKLIADLKNKHSQGESKPHITEKKQPAPAPQIPTETITAEKIDLQLQEPTPQQEPNTKPKESKSQDLNAPKAQEEAKAPKEVKPKIAESKKSAPKPQAKEDKQPQTKASSKSASQLFQSVESSTPKGFYLQVGVFGGTPQKSFLDKLKNFSYKTDKIQRNGKTLTRYLIGPFPSREIAQSKINQITLEINKPVIVEIR